MYWKRSINKQLNLRPAWPLTKFFGVFFTLCSFLAVSGCATTDQVDSMKWELNTLRGDVRKLKTASENAETQMPGQIKKIDNKIKSLEDKQDATANTVSDMLIKVQTLTSEFQILTGQFEEGRHLSEKNTAEAVESREALIVKIKELELAIDELKKKFSELAARKIPDNDKDKSAGVSEGTGKTDKDLQEDKKEPEKSVDDKAREVEVKDVYMAAYQAYKEGRSAEAREQFISLLKKYPENEYSDNARLWVAESYFAEGSYEDAILAYEELFKKNPQSDKIPGAMLKQGSAFFELKDKKTGTIILEKLIEKYPDSKQAKSAKTKLGKSDTPKKKK